MDSNLPKVMLQYKGTDEGVITVNGRDYRVGTGETTRYVEVAQEDVEALLARGKFEILSDWFKLLATKSKKTDDATTKQ